MVDSACIFYGDTPTCLFTSWRLSYTSISIIHISDKLSSDGIVSWKSDNFGSNFYTPNVFINNILKEKNENESILKLKQKLKGFKIDYLYLSCNSTFEFEEVSKKLSNIINEDTVIFVESNFGVNLDLLVYDQIKIRNKINFTNNVVFGVLSNLEGRKLTSGSFILLSNEVEFHFGLSYIQTKKEFEEEFLEYLKKVTEQLSNNNSKLNFFIESINSTGQNMIKLKKTSILDNEFAIRIWNHVIPKLAFHLISVIYEDTEYNHFLNKNQSMARELSYSILKELVIIAFHHLNCNMELLSPTNNQKQLSGPHFLPLIKNSKELENIDNLIDYEQCLSIVLEKKKFLNCETHNKTSPEFVSFSFEAYSFYHKLEYPASILLSQPFELSKDYNCSAVCLKFLGQFYERLCILSGMPIFLKQSTKLIDGLNNESIKRQSLIFGKTNNIFYTSSVNNKNLVEINESLNDLNFKSSQINKKKKRNIKQDKKHKAKRLDNDQNSNFVTNIKSTKDTQDLLAEEIAALYFDSYEKVSLLNNVDCQQKVTIPTVQETALDDLPYNHSYKECSYETSETNTNTTNTSSERSSIGSQLFFNDEEFSDTNHFKNIQQAKKTLYRKSFELPKKKKYDPNSSFNKAIQNECKNIKKKSKFDILKCQTDNDINLTLCQSKHVDSNNFKYLSRLSKSITEQEILGKLSHTSEVTNKYLYHQHSEQLFSIPKSPENKMLVLKRRQLMDELSKFRRFKIEQHVNFGYGNNYQGIFKEELDRVQSVSLYKYMEVLSAPINLDMTENSSNRYGSTDSLEKLVKSLNLKGTKTIQSDSKPGKKQKLIEY
ncbi:hypothetical protein QEN19_003805 [Hanseniaspora menglaensis]